MASFSFPVKRMRKTSGNGVKLYMRKTKVGLYGDEMKWRVSKVERKPDNIRALKKNDNTLLRLVGWFVGSRSGYRKHKIIFLLLIYYLYFIRQNDLDRWDGK